ncbi:CHRD domain-containing protein [Arenibacter certesii]|uniref:CHRD domain-containing protein n=1 Tax=Arenibacter certesii TaxID=228955 RepID=A0A918MQL7_9FLAO|nr:CHRD domain-containing protein [Arenibacter certesii]GGW44482.1 hypothetical protein GCM10007383_31170 [Arenibacter certesii]
MKKILYLFTMVTALVFTSCTNDDHNAPGEFNGESKIYQLESRSNNDIKGTATIVENADGSATVNLKLDGTATGSHPAHIHANSAAESGDIIVDLTPVDGATGESTTIISARKDGTKITYDQILELDGYINVHQSASDLGTLIAQGDIGINELVGESKEYELNSVVVPTIKGTATIHKRISGASLLEIELEGTPEDGEHPAHIHANTAAESGDILISLSSVNGKSRKSWTHIEADNEGTEVMYEDLLEYNGYINVHLSGEELGVIVAQGDIGQNELTGNQKSYNLVSVANASISGTATFSERVNKQTLVTLELAGTTAGGIHPAHIHMGSVADAPGDIVVSLTNVIGATGISKTNVAQLDAGGAVDYEALLAIDGYINVHLGADQLGTLIAQGNVGANVN